MLRHWTPLAELTATVGVAIAVAAAGPPAPGTRLPHEPGRLAHTLAEANRELEGVIDRWLATGAVARGEPPQAVTLWALHQQRIYMLLTRDEQLSREAIARLPSGLATEARSIVTARRALARLTTPQPLGAFRVGPPRPAGILLRYYREAERRFRVAWHVLAAVNFVESAFGKLRNASTAGAQGPMQFLPATWRAYGLGGNVHDPRDAILGAANYLRASGAPRDYRRALYAYNPSTLYVDAVLRYAERIRRDRRAFFAFYSWQVFVQTPLGVRRLTGPGVPRRP